MFWEISLNLSFNSIELFSFEPFIVLFLRAPYYLIALCILCVGARGEGQKSVDFLPDCFRPHMFLPPSFAHGGISEIKPLPRSVGSNCFVKRALRLLGSQRSLERLHQHLAPVHFLASRNSLKGLVHGISSPGSFHHREHISFLFLSMLLAAWGEKRDKCTRSVSHL